MEGYWWQCTNCSKQLDFKKLEGNGIVSFFWDILSPTWDQNLLVRECPKCGEKSMRITYKFPRKAEETISVMHIFGLKDFREEFLPMIWEGMPHSNPNDRWFDFKYLGQKGKRGASQGLNRPAVFSQKEFARLLRLYEEKTGRSLIKGE